MKEIHFKILNDKIDKISELMDDALKLGGKLYQVVEEYRATGIVISSTGEIFHSIYADENDVRALMPELGLLEQLHPYGVVVTAPGNRTDCVSRYFAPSYGIPEDPVTGSIHCALVPYWAKQVNKTKIHAHQASKRGGDLYCENKGDRVLIGGQAVRYLKGTITF